MLQKSKAFSSFSVDDIEKAKSFYSDTLGLTIKKGGMGTLDLHIEGGTWILIYPKANHEPATFTILNFPVKNIDQAVDALSAKGIVFEQYDNPKTDNKGIYRGAEQDSGSNIAWFKDPAGNTLSIIEK